jgi:hypothetical protein
MSDVTLHWSKDRDGRHWEAQSNRGVYRISHVPDTPKDCYYGLYRPDPKCGPAWSKPFESLGDAQEWAEAIEHGKRPE